jgi:translation initiation factor IF-3
MNPADSEFRQINFHLNLSEDDYGVKVRHAEESLWNGEKVNLQLKFRGSEMMRMEEGIALVRRMIGDLSGVGATEIEPTRVGKSIKLTIFPLSPDKRFRKFST